SMALASLLNPSTGAADDTGMRGFHHAPKAKRIIHLYQAGGPSHLETFDYKPKLGEMNGQSMPESFTKGQPIAQLQGAKLTCFAPQVQFRRYGKGGVEMSEHFPKLGAVSDEICVIRSLVTEQINHDPAHTFMNTGTSISGRPSMGSWLWYGLGADTENLPGFVVLTSSGRGGQNQPIATRQWSSGFIPSKYQGVHFRSQGEPVLYLGNPASVTAGRQRDVIDSVDELNRIHLDSVDDPEISTRISQYEMAGGGIQGGLMHGATDEVGYHAVQDVVHVHDLHATMLHQRGIDRKRLTLKFQGRDFRLTDVHGNVVKKILA